MEYAFGKLSVPLLSNWLIIQMIDIIVHNAKFQALETYIGFDVFQ